MGGYKRGCRMEDLRDQMKSSSAKRSHLISTMYTTSTLQRLPYCTVCTVCTAYHDNPLINCHNHSGFSSRDHPSNASVIKLFPHTLLSFSSRITGSCTMFNSPINACMLVERITNASPNAVQFALRFRFLNLLEYLLLLAWVFTSGVPNQP